MKKFKMVVMIFLLFFSVALLAETEIENEDKKTDEKSDNQFFSITVYPIPAFMGWYSVESELSVSNNVSFAFEGKQWADTEEENGESWDFVRLEAGLGLRYYPNHVQKGVFLGMYFDYLGINVDYKDDEGYTGTGRANGYSITGWLGYKWIIGHLVLELSTGCSYSSLGSVSIEVKDNSGNVAKQNYNSGTGDFAWSGIGVGIGMAF